MRLLFNSRDNRHVTLIRWILTTSFNLKPHCHDELQSRFAEISSFGPLPLPPIWNLNAVCDISGTYCHRGDSGWVFASRTLSWLLALIFCSFHFPFSLGYCPPWAALFLANYMFYSNFRWHKINRKSYHGGNELSKWTWVRSAPCEKTLCRVFHENLY